MNREKITKYITNNKQYRLSAFSEHYAGEERIVDHRKYKEIIQVFCTLVSNAIIQTGSYYTIPWKLGAVGIEKKYVIEPSLLDFKEM